MSSMNIDQRLDRLTERHEALTQTVELIAQMQLRSEQAHLKNEEAQQKNEVLLAQVMESVGSLARIAHLHEQRITDIEDRRQ